MLLGCPFPLESLFKVLWMHFKMLTSETHCIYLFPWTLKPQSNCSLSSVASEPAQNLLFGLWTAPALETSARQPCKANPVPFPSCLYQGYLQFYTVSPKVVLKATYRKSALFIFLECPGAHLPGAELAGGSRPSERAPAPPRGPAPPVATGVTRRGREPLCCRHGWHAPAPRRLEVGDRHPQQPEDPRLAPPEWSRWFQGLPGQNWYKNHCLSVGRWSEGKCRK